MPKYWRKFQPGALPTGANIEIMEIVQDASTQMHLVYRVRLLCCNHERKMRHSDVVKRMREGSGQCRKCRGTGGGEDRGLKLNKRFPDPPWWRTPESVLAQVRPGWRWS